jgi:hypothetical protein
MLALLATSTVQALVSMALLAPPVFAPVAAAAIGVSASRIGFRIGAASPGRTPARRLAPWWAAAPGCWPAWD